MCRRALALDGNVGSWPDEDTDTLLQLTDISNKQYVIDTRMRRRLTARCCGDMARGRLASKYLKASSPICYVTNTSQTNMSQGAKMLGETVCRLGERGGDGAGG